MRRRSVLTTLAVSLALAALGGCGLLFDFDYHAADTTSSGTGGHGGAGSSTQSSSGAQGGGGQTGTGGQGGNGGCLDTTSDSKNCGKCGWDCLGGTCDKGECQAVVVVQGTAGQDDFNHLTMDDTTLYWTSKGKILAVDKGAAPMSAPSLSTPDLGADAIAVDATNVYWSVFLAGSMTAVNRAPKANPTTLTPVAPAELQPASLVLGANLYWSEYNTGGAIRTASTTATSGMDLVRPEDRVLSLTPVGPDLYWTYRGLDDAHGGVKRWIQGSVTEIAKDEHAPSGLAVDATDVYWVDYDGIVRKAPREPATPLDTPTSLSPFEGTLFYAEIAVDNVDVYWTGIHTVWRVPKDGSASPVDFGGASWAAVPAMKMSGRVLYWTTGTDAKLMRKVKRAP
ncbi:MAG: hypothetical protein QM820_28250 [Minicystis sp.]